MSKWNNDIFRHTSQALEISHALFFKTVTEGCVLKQNQEKRCGLQKPRDSTQCRDKGNPRRNKDSQERQLCTLHHKGEIDRIYSVYTESHTIGNSLVLISVWKTKVRDKKQENY